MTALHTEAIVLRATDFGESDRIVQLLTPAAGRVTAIAKGARRSRRRFPGTLDLFHRLRVHIERPRRMAMSRLEGARLVSHFPGLREDTRRFALACVLVELLARVAPEEATGRDAVRLFAFAAGALAALDVQIPGPQSRVLLMLRALDAAGVRPELRRCVRCGRDVEGQDRVGFHVGEGGPVCAGCERGETLLPVQLGTLRALERGLALPLESLDRLRLSPSALREAHALLARFDRFHLGIELRSERFLDKVLPAVSDGRND
jgi:DNA repair protein RecO (recombination protein O)